MPSLAFIVACTSMSVSTPKPSVLSASMVRLTSCHTAQVGSYIIEGHVPAADIERLLKEKPKALGLAVPGMVAGSPGMESDDPPEHYDTMLVQADGSTRIFARH